MPSKKSKSKSKVVRKPSVKPPSRSSKKTSVSKKKTSRVKSTSPKRQKSPEKKKSFMHAPPPPGKTPFMHAPPPPRKTAFMHAPPGKTAFMHKKPSERKPFMHAPPGRTSRRTKKHTSYIRPVTGPYAPYVHVPKRDKYYTPSKIAQIFGQQVQTIEGPVSYTILVPTPRLNDMLGHDGPVIVLFGDVHVGNDRCKQRCEVKHNCYSFYAPNPTIVKFLNQLGQKIHIDLFLEIWSPLLNRINQYGIPDLGDQWRGKTASALRSIKNYLLNCLEIKDGIRNKDCLATNFYVHMSDTRHAKDKLDAIMRHMIPEMDYEDLKLWLTAQLPDLTMDKLTQLIRKRLLMGPATFLQTVARHEPIFQRHSKTIKQLSALPTALQDIIYKHYPQSHVEESRECDIPYKERQLPKPSRSTQDSDLQREYDGYQKIVTETSYGRENKCHWSGATSELDLYFLGRSLKVPKDGPISQLSIGYFGDHHVRQLTSFLTDQKLYTTYKYKSHRHTLKSPNKKCVSI